MNKSFFETLAEQENGKLTINSENVSTNIGAKSPSIIYKLRLNYKECEIIINYKTGTSFVGNINCKLSKNIKATPFEINTISQLKSLFYRKNNRFKIITKKEYFYNFLINNEPLKYLNQVSIKENFTPIIICETNNIDCEFHLEFKNPTQVVKPLIEFLKNVIDEFNRTAVA
jgi:hypothetical protein